MINANLPYKSSTRFIPKTKKVLGWKIKKKLKKMISNLNQQRMNSAANKVFSSNACLIRIRKKTSYKNKFKSDILSKPI